MELIEKPEVENTNTPVEIEANNVTLSKTDNKNAVETYLAKDVSPDLTYKSVTINQAINPDYSKKAVLQPVPKNKKIDDIINEDVSIASALKDTRQYWDKAANTFKVAKDGLTIGSANEIEKSELAYKLMMDKANFSDAEMTRLLDLSEDEDEQGQDNPETLWDGTESVAISVGQFLRNTAANVPASIGVGAATTATATGAAVAAGAVTAPVTGGVSLAAGAGFGLATGLSAATTYLSGATAYDSFKQQSGSFYLQMKKDPDLQLGDDDLKALSLGLGATVGSLDFFIAKGATKALNVGQTVLKDKIVKDRLIAIGRFIIDKGIDGANEATQEIAQIAAEETAKGKPVTLTAILDQSDRIGQAAVAGTVASTTIEGTAITTKEVVGGTFRFGRSLGEKGSIEVKNKSGKVKFLLKNENANKEDVRKMQRMMMQGKAINEITDAITNSKLETETTNFVLRRATEEDNVYLNKEAVSEIVEKNEAAKQYVQENLGIDIQDNHAVSPAVIAQLNAIDPAFINAWSSEPDGPTLSTIEQYTKGLQEAVELAYNLDEDITGLKEAERKLLPSILREAPQVDRSNPNSIPTYAASKLFKTKNLEVPSKFSSKLNKALKGLKADAATRTVVEFIKKANKAVALDYNVKRMLEVEGKTFHINSIRYHKTHKKFSTREYSNAEKKLPTYDPSNGVSVYAIDPNTLDAKTKKEYLNNSTLLKLGVFTDPSKAITTTTSINDPIGTVTGSKRVRLLKGMDANESAAMLGYGSPRELFAALIIADSEFDSVSEVLEGQDLEAMYEESANELGATEQDIINEINNVESHRRREIRQLFTQAKDIKGNTIKGVRTYTKEAIVKLVRGMRPTHDLAAEGVKIARSLNVRNLDPVKFRNNSDKLRVDSIKAFQEGRYTDSIKASEQSILNLQIEKEVVRINKELTRKVNKLRTFSTIENRNILMRGEPIAVNALDHIMQIFSFSRDYDVPSQEVIDLIQTLNTKDNYFIPVANGYAPKASINDLSAQTTLALAETAINIFETIKANDKIQGEQYDADQKVSFDSINQSIAQLANRKTYNPNNWDKRPTSENSDSTLRQSLGLTAAVLTRVQSVIKNKLDRNEVNGFFTRLIWKPVQRANDFFLNVINAKELLMERAVNEYGRDNYLKLSTTEIIDDRLKDNEYFRDRKPNKLDIIVMALNSGNLGNLEVLARSMNLSQQEIRSILDDNLTAKDWKLVQTIWDSFIPLWDEVVKTKKAVREDIPEKVHAQQFELKDGTIIRGGYYPIEYQYDIARVNQSDLVGNTGRQAFKFENMSQNGHNESRLQNVGRKLNLNIDVYNRAFKEIAYDTSYRAVIRNLNRIFADQTNQKHFYNTLGEGDYQAMKEFVQGLSDEHERMGQLDRTVDKAVSLLQNLAVRGYLGFKVTTALIQPEAFIRAFYAISKDMKGKPLKAALRVFLEAKTQFLTIKPESMQAQIEAVAQVSPRFRDLMKQMGVPSTIISTDSIAGDTRGNVRKFFDATNFGILSYMNNRINLATWFAAVKLAEQGYIPNVDPNNKQDVYDYATEVVTLHLQGDESIDKAYFQRSQGVMKLFTTFMSQQLVRFNELKAAANDAKSGWIEAESFNDRLKVAGQAAMDLTMMSILPAIYVGIIRNLFKEEDDRTNVLTGALLDPITTIPLGSNLVYQTSTIIEGGKPRSSESVVALGFLNDAVISSAAIASRVLKNDKIDNNELRRIVNVAQASGIPVRQVVGMFWLGEYITNKTEQGVDALESFVLFNDAPKTIDEYDQGLKDVATSANLTEEQTIKAQELEKAIDQEAEKEGEPPQIEPEQGDFDNPHGGRDYLIRDTGMIEINSDMHDDLVNIASIIRYAESTNNPLARNRRSSAKGYYQVLDGTADLFDKAYPLDDFKRLKELPPPNDIVAIKAYNELQNKFIWREFAENVDGLRRDDLPVNVHTLYAMHVLGSEVGRMIFKGSDNKTIPKSKYDDLYANTMATMGVRTLEEAKKIKNITYGEVRNNLLNYLNKRIVEMGSERGEEYALLMGDYLDTDIDFVTK